MSAARGSGIKQEQPSYWLRTSPSAPSHILRTPHHAIAALCGAGGFACFSIALLQKKPFDAVLAVVLVLVCLYIYTLQSERRKRKSEWRESVVGASLDSLSIDLPMDAKIGGRGSRSAAARAAADGTSELDLTGYAKTLGVSIRNGVVHKEGTTLNKILMDALAKEYLRCVSALRCYQTAFGPLQEDAPDQDEVATQSARDPSMRGPDPLSTTYNSLNLAMDLAALAEPAAATPRDVAGPPSPDPKRCRAPPLPLNSETQPIGLEASPAPAVPANTPATAQPKRERSSSSTSEAAASGYAYSNPCVEQTSAESPVWGLDEIKAGPCLIFSEAASDSRSGAAPSPVQPAPFGMFGSRMQNL